MQAVTESPTSGMHPQDISQVLFSTSGLCVCVWLLHLFVLAFITIGSCEHTCFSLSIQSKEIIEKGNVSAGPKIQVVCHFSVNIHDELPCSGGGY